jgi:DNA modification methylase
MKRRLLYLLLLFPLSSFCQEFDFGKPTNDDFNFERTKIDSNANAVYLDEYGTTRFSFDSETGQMKLLHVYHAKIKIFKKEGFEIANVVVPLYKSGTGNSQAEYISQIHGGYIQLRKWRYQGRSDE